jgi:16S rRNA (cytosine1402-N4)-methyltransferase
MYHVPVMLAECLEGLQINPDGVYVDVTFGGGGHSRAILDKLSAQGRLYAFDQDPDVLPNVPEDPRFKLFQVNFRYLARYMRLEGVKEVDGILADLGVSSFQFDEKERGFSYRANAPLDMRMSKSGEKTAADVLGTYTETELWKLFEVYGEVRNAKSLARRIAEFRQVKKILTIDDFLTAIDKCVKGDRMRYLSQVFQAVRIEVNDELVSLKEMLVASLGLLKPGGRLVVMSYHSLEDRLVKQIMKTGTFDGVFIQDDFGKIYRPFKVVTKKPVTASLEEIQGNFRARSAKLRIAEKI